MTIARLAFGMLVMCLISAPLAAAHELTPDQLQSVTFDQRLGQQVPLDLSFHDENGQLVSLNGYFGQRPVILTLNYFHCRNLCPLQLDGLMNSLNGVSFTLGQEFGVVSVSIDPHEGADDATSIKLRTLRGYDKPQNGTGWHVLTGDQPTIDRLTRSVGFTYSYDADTDEYAHPLGMVVLSPGGQISRYLYGLDFASNDVRLALVDASAGRIGSLLDRALLICYHYDPLTGRYTPLALNLLRGGGAAGAVAMAGFLGWMFRAERRRSPPPVDGAT